MGIPTNLITGFLGVGKTTAVIDLLKGRPPGSRWAVLVNEYGDVSIDGAMIEGETPEGVSVREVGGGCVCCASAPYLPVALHFLLIDAKPERLIIETTGLGHPARLLDTLRRNYADRLDLRATLTLVDPADFAKAEMRTNPVFIDQIQLADVVVMNKLDTATPELVTDFQTWTNGLFPPKLLIAGTTHGHLDPAWLDLTANDERLPLYPEAHEHQESVVRSRESGIRSLKSEARSQKPEVRNQKPDNRSQLPVSRPSTTDPGFQTPDPRVPVRYPSPAGVLPACCGWVFHPADVFNQKRLLALLSGTPGITRLKGVFHFPVDWSTVNRSDTAVSVTPTAYRRDSRLEVFSDVLNWAEFEAELLQCVLPHEPLA